MRCCKAEILHELEMYQHYPANRMAVKHTGPLCNELFTILKSQPFLSNALD